MTAFGWDEPQSFAPTLSAAIAALPDRGRAWRLDASADLSGRWLSVRQDSVDVPEQGWKLHVSAGVPAASETLRRVVPILMAEPTAFKVAATPATLAALNDGTGALSQVGKFVTVYPTDDAQAVRLATALADATRGLRGPPVPSDRPLAAGSVVHYRYGSFGARVVQSRNGEMAFAVRDPLGALEPDVRGTSYQPPAWADDPFLAAGVAPQLHPPSPLVGDRFLVVGSLHRSARGNVYVAVDLDGPRSCVLKHAYAGALLAPDGRDARDQLRHEAQVLERLAPDPRFPTPLAVLEHDDGLYLAMDDLRGSTLESHVVSQNATGRTLAPHQVVAWGRELAAMLDVVHGAGIVYRDLKSTNVLVMGDGHLGLVDFELACPRGERGRTGGRGTRGYMSPQQVDGAPAQPADDVYGLGALLAYLATGAEPSQAPGPQSLLDRPLELLNPSISPGIAAIITRCLAPGAGDRFATAADASAALEGIGAEAIVRPAGPAHPRPAVTTEDEAAARQRSRTLAQAAGDAICAAAEPVAGGSGLAWRSAHPLGLGVQGRDLNTGVAGTVLALAEIVDAFGVPTHADALRAGARWLLGAPPLPGGPLPGLYVGEAGVAAALLRAGQVLGDEPLLAEATARGRSVALLPHASPDLFNGSAGRLRMHVLLWEETGDSRELRDASAAASHLLDTAEEDGGGGRRWIIPAGYGGISGRAYLGYAHGAAGIADALLDLFEVTGDERHADAARGAARWLAGLAQPALDDGSGLCWPTTEEERPAAAYWCHGATGVGRFWLHAAALDLLPEAGEIASRAIATAAHGVRWSMPPQCHGLAGAIELLLDAYQAGGDPARLGEARDLERLLHAFAIDDHGVVWPSESPLVVTPDFNVGYAGVAATLVRLGDPGRRAHALDRRAFRRRRTGAGPVSSLDTKGPQAYRPEAGPASERGRRMASDADEELRVKAYQLVARAEGDPEFARMVRADPGAVLREVGISEDVLTAGVAGQKASALPERWGCNDFTCWSSACPGTCYVTFCHTTYYRD